MDTFEDKILDISFLGLGWLGLPCALNLKQNGHLVGGTTRFYEKKQKLESLGIKSFDLLDREALRAKIIIVNIPPFENQLKLFQDLSWDKNAWVIFISSTSVYQDAPQLLDESSPTHKESLLIQEEDFFKNQFKRWTILRAGGLWGEDRHPGKHLAGRSNLKNRLWPVNLAHLEDVIGFINSLISKKIYNEIFNLVGNNHPTREEFYTHYAKVNNLPLPGWDLNDHSLGKTISNQKASAIYSFKY